MEAFLLTPLVTHVIAAVGGLSAYPVVHYFVSKVSTSVSSDIAALKAQVAALEAKLPKV
jgi:hypothetical protein